MKRISTSFITFSLFVFIAVTSLISCKEDTILNADIVPVGDTVHSIIIPDTLTIYTKTVLDDSAVTGDSIYVSGLTVNHALGVMSTDIYSGRTTAGIYFQIVQPSLNFAFPAPPDSAVLILPYAGFTWGDTTSGFLSQTFNVHEITGDFPKGKIYSNRSEVAYDATVIGTGTVSSHQSTLDSVSDLGVNRPPHLRIKLAGSFVDKIKNASSSTVMNAYANFLSFFKGFYIEPVNTVGNGMVYFQMISSYSGTDYNRANVLFYYTEDGEVKTRSFFYDPTNAARFNRITRDYTGTPTQDYFNSTALSDSVFVIQNEPGAALDILIPHVKNLPKNPVNKAELVITQYSFAGDNASTYFGPQRLYPTRVDENGNTVPIQDRYPLAYTEPLLFIDGNKRSITIGGITYTRYIINLPRELQRAIVEQRESLHLRIAGASGYPGAFRLIGAGSNVSDPNMKIKLNIVFSKI